MNKNICIPRVHVIEKLEREIIEEKTKAYQIALGQFFPVPILFQTFVSDYKRKLRHQFETLFKVAKQIYVNTEKKREILKKNFPKYYHHTPLYSILFLQVPPIFTPNFSEARSVYILRGVEPPARATAQRPRAAIAFTATLTNCSATARARASGSGNTFTFFIRRSHAPRGRTATFGCFFSGDLQPRAAPTSRARTMPEGVISDVPRPGQSGR